jgi:hypothetical protein
MCVLVKWIEIAGRTQQRCRSLPAKYYVKNIVRLDSDFTRILSSVDDRLLRVIDSGSRLQFGCNNMKG